MQGIRIKLLLDGTLIVCLQTEDESVPKFLLEFLYDFKERVSEFSGKLTEDAVPEQTPMKRIPFALEK